MKRFTLLFPRKIYRSSDGTLQAYFHSEELCDVLGQADTIRLHFNGVSRSARGQATLTTYESGLPTGRPDEVGVQIGAATVTSATGPTLATISGPFAGRVSVKLEIDDTGGPAAQWFECEVYATVIITG